MTARDPALLTASASVVPSESVRAMMYGLAPGVWTSSIGVLSLFRTAPLEKTQKPIPHFGHQPARSAMVSLPPQAPQTLGSTACAPMLNQVVGAAPSIGYVRMIESPVKATRETASAVPVDDQTAFQTR